jgi:hypothetical protein
MAAGPLTARAGAVQASAAGPVTGKPKHRVGNVAMMLMLMASILLDGVQILLQFIPIIGQIISLLLGVLAAVFFALWFMLLGVNYFSGKKAGVKLAAVFSSVIVEIIPIVDALPAISFGVLAVIMASRSEDKRNARKEGASTPTSRTRFRMGPQKIQP